MYCKNCKKALSQGELFCSNCGIKAENVMNENIIKKKKFKWWIPLLFFVGGVLMILGSIAIEMIIHSTGESPLDYEITQNPIIMIFKWLGWISWLLVIPSLIIVIVKYNKKTPEEKQQKNFQLINLINNGNTLDEKLLIAYIGNNYEKIMQKKFSVPALFLSWIYTLYRKVYLPSIIGMIVIIILAFLPPTIYYILTFAFVIVLGIYFNKWYITYAKKQINKIKMNNKNVNENELINICIKKGGTNVWIAILIYVVFVTVNWLVVV